MRNLIVAALVAYCGAVGAILWERLMRDAPDWLWRAAFVMFWLAVAGIIALTDPVNALVIAHPKAAAISFGAWGLVWILASLSSRFRSAQLEMRFIEGKNPYFEHDTAQVNGTTTNATTYRISIDSDKAASVSVTVDGVQLEASERHDIPLHRMGDQTNIETITEVLPGRSRYWEVAVYAKELRFLAMPHIQHNLPKELRPTNQSFTIIASSQGAREIRRIASIALDESGELIFELKKAKETKRLLRSSL